MAALSAVVFALSWWLGLYLLIRNPRKPVLALAAAGLTSFAAVVALDAVRLAGGADIVGRIEVYLVAVPGIAWFAVLLSCRGHRTPRAAASPRWSPSPRSPWSPSAGPRWRAASRARCGPGTG